MKCKVQLYKAGTQFDEIVVARDYQDAKNVALARNPGATVISVTAVLMPEKFLKPHCPFPSILNDKPGIL